jgi:hypothetical protein
MTADSTGGDADLTQAVARANRSYGAACQS